MQFKHAITQLSIFRKTGVPFVALFFSCLVTTLAATPTEMPVATPKSTNAAASSLAWNHLSAQKQQSLRPLQQVWPLLTEAHQRKWLTLARNFPTMTPEEQTKLHSRMVEWAALKPKDRQLARLNFAETKQLTPEERAANWEAYQALSPQKRKELAAQALANKGNSGALSNRPSKNQRLITIAPRRMPPDALRTLMEQQNSVNVRTLLPLHQAQSQDP